MNPPDNGQVGKKFFRKIGNEEFFVCEAKSRRRYNRDSTGQLIATLNDKQQPRGKYTVQWNGIDRNGKNVPSGLYFL